jgi:prevent-host-death family protein
MKGTTISDLKAHLSAYLSRVRRGETVIVCDRSTPIARLVPYDGRPGGFELLPPSRPRNDLSRIKPIVPRRPVDVVRLLREDRDSR